MASPTANGAPPPYVQSPPKYTERFPEGRDRLLALAESSKPRTSSVLTTTSGDSSTKKPDNDPPTIAPAQAPFVNLRAPRMGLRKIIAKAPPPPASNGKITNLSTAKSWLSQRLLVAQDAPSGDDGVRDVGAGFSYWAAAPHRPPPPSSMSAVTPPSRATENLRTDFLFAKHGQVSLEELRRLYSSLPDCSSAGVTPRNEASEEENHVADTNHYENDIIVRRRSSFFDAVSGEATYVDIQEIQSALASSQTAHESEEHPSTNGVDHHERCSPSVDSGYRSVPRSLDADLHKCCITTGTPPKRPPPTPVAQSPKETPKHESDKAVTNNDSAYRLVLAKNSSLDELTYAESLSPTGFSDRSSSLSSYCSGQSSSRVAPGRSEKLSVWEEVEDAVSPTTSAEYDSVSLEKCAKLAELDRVPWNEKDIVAVLQRGRTREFVNRIAVDVVPRLTYLLQRPLVRIARELRRLSSRIGSKCTKHDSVHAVRLVLPCSIAEACVRAGHEASAMYGLCGENVRISQSARAGLRLNVGKFVRWMRDAQIARCVHEQAVVFIAACIENVLETLVLSSLPPLGSPVMLTADNLDEALTKNNDLWGVLQPYEHLMTARRGAVQEGVTNQKQNRRAYPDKPKTNGSVLHQIDRGLLTTCVQSMSELVDLVSRVVQHSVRSTRISTASESFTALPSTPSNPPSSTSGKHPPPSWSRDALCSLFYFMQCPSSHPSRTPESWRSVRQRAYSPPLSEWLRVATVLCDHRQSCCVDADDVLQTARVLLPGVDAPPRLISQTSLLTANLRQGTTSPTSSEQLLGRLRADLSMHLINGGRTELLLGGLQPLTQRLEVNLNAFDCEGLTPLMLACIHGDDTAASALIQAGARLNLTIPVSSSSSPLSEFAGWSALTFAVSSTTNASLIQRLLERGASVASSEMCTETPLQIAAMSGDREAAVLLLSYGADSFYSTRVQDAGYKRRGCAAPVVLAAAAGHRALTRLLVDEAQPGGEETTALTLKDFLAAEATPPRRQLVTAVQKEQKKQKLSKAQLRTLQEAMYCAAEAGYVDITMDLRGYGVAWNLHIWTQTLGAAHELRRKPLIQLLLADFIAQKFVGDVDADFVDDCLPLLFDIFRHSKNEAVSASQVAEILSLLFGRDAVPPCDAPPINATAKIDAKYVNSPDLSDVQFLVDGQLFYAHRIVLVNASERFRSLLNGSGDATKPIAVMETSYATFTTMMEYLYNGTICFDRSRDDLISLLASSTRFDITPLKSLCEHLLSLSLDSSSCLCVYAAAVEHDAPRLLRFCESFILQKLPEMLAQMDAFRKSGQPKFFSTTFVPGLLRTLSQRIQARLASRR